MKNYLALILLLTTYMGSAQQGSVSGKVIDETTGEDLVGVVIQVDSSGMGAATDLFGEFIIKNVPSGIHVLTVNYISYQSKKITGVLVSDGKDTRVDITLNSAPIETGTVQITDFRVTNNEAAVLLEMKEARGVMSGMSARQIAKSQDPDAAAVAKRIPGVTIVDNRFVMVRGLTERYNTVTLNGAIAPSLETDAKSFSFDLVPSGLIERLLIYKSPSPDVQGEFAGGAINLITRDFPDRSFEVKASYMAGYREGTTGERFIYSQNGSKDWLGLGASERQLPEGFPVEVRSLDANALQALGRSLPNTWSYSVGEAPVDQRGSVSFGKQFKLRNAKLGSITALNYSRTFQAYGSELNNYNVYDFVNELSDTTETISDSIYSSAVRLGIMQNFGYRHKNHQVSFRNFFNQSGLSENTLRNSIDMQNGFNRKSYQFRYMERSLYTGQLSGTHTFGSSSEVSWMGGYNHVNRSEPDLKRITYLQPLEDQSIPYQAYITPSAQPFYLGRLFMDMTEKAWNASASYQYYHDFLKTGEEDKSKWVSLKTGVYLQQKDREFALRNLGYRTSPHFNYDLTALPIDQILDPENINNDGGFTLDEDTKGSDEYTASNILKAYYGMAIVPAGNWNISGGLRIEDNTQQLQSETLTGDKVNVDKQVVSMLPSVNVSYNFTDEMLVRASWGKTVNRPEFRELAPFSYYDFVQNLVIEGNPDLEIPQISNYDLRWEFYPQPSELISVGLFYKDFSNPIELSLDPSSTPWNVDPYNALRSFSYGSEIDIRKSMKDVFTSRFLSGFTIVANASYIESEVTIRAGESTTENTKPRAMMFQSPYVVNGGLYWQDDTLDLSVNVLYNVIGPRLFLAGINGLPDVYDMPRHVVDITLTKGIGKNFSIRLSAQDILNQRNLLLQDANTIGGLDASDDQRRQRFQRGAYFMAGIVFSMQSER